ncbi:phosphoglucosamine mutase [Andreesenia angusta]|uniref:Phosphoglucosamine mutase n=1 Tax=Andreesenia angusta TaxID=39480 RepID=A0A1S1V6T3_9FIRM|nr:phosphoglucosamine mutase [Andreesenia angusta]OHW62120.1 phosphoglucosamine mutase [Andreesenia angusta]
MGKYFGTDGVRGIANTELSPELSYKIGRAGAHVLTNGKKHVKIIVGKDTRISGDMLEAALESGICSVGADVISVGVIPTPAVAHLVREYGADAGVVISASHNPVEYNGIKFLDSQGFKLPDSVEEEIERLIDSELEGIPSPTGSDVGRFLKQETACEDYIDFLMNAAETKLDGMKVALDCSEGAAFKCAPELFKRLGADVYTIHNNPDGTNINKDCGSTHLEAIKQFTVENKCDIGLAFDGDADRCLAVDENGEEVNGDFIMTVLAKHFKDKGELEKDTLVVTVMSNMGLFIACDREGIKLEKTKVGDRYVLENMKANGYKIGGEQSGHIILLDHNTTGDGLLTALYLTTVLKESGKALSDLKSVMTELPQVLVNAKVPNEKKNIFNEDECIVEKIREVESSLDGRGRVLIRASGTEPLVRVMLEGENIEEIEQMANEIADMILAKSK